MLPQKELYLVGCWCDTQPKSVLPVENSMHFGALRNSPNGQTEALGVGSAIQRQ
jgi:hypothetical protein